MNIQLKRLSLTNFKGIRSLVITFLMITNIFGENGTGKTTVFDAFLWLLFGKDSTDRKDFEIKTLGPDNEPFHKLDHEVEATITVDGDEVKIRKCLRENWVKKRGSAELEFSGHTTFYFWDDVPMKLEQFQEKISGILKESIFKLITNTGYFNSLKWQERRNVLEQMDGSVSDKELLQQMITGGADKYAPLLAALTGNKTVEEYGRTISANKKKLKDELLTLPGRIDEANRSLPEPVDYDAIDKLLQGATGELQGIESQLMDKSQALRDHEKLISAKVTQIQQLKQDRVRLEYDIRNTVQGKRQERQQEILNLTQDLNNLNSELNRLTTQYSLVEKRLVGIQETQNLLRGNWTKVDGEVLTFDENKFACPTCHRAYEATDIEEKKTELTNNFNQDKAKRLTDITDRGTNLATEAKTAEVEMENIASVGTTKRAESGQLQERINTLVQANERLVSEEENNIAEAIKIDAGILELDDKLSILNTEINAPAPGNDNADLLLQKGELNKTIGLHNNQLSTKAAKEKTEKRIAELVKQESEMAAELAGYEGIEFNIEQFIKEKIGALEERINSRFKHVKFKMFEQQINGGWVPCCETLIKGIPYSDTNNASRINAGLDIINTLSAHYGVSAPVFVDNAESVNTLIPVNSQLVRLVVSLDKELRIESI